MIREGRGEMEHLNEGFDICYKCGKSQEYGTMTDITDIGFDIYCDKCHKEEMKIQFEELRIAEQSTKQP